MLRPEALAPGKQGGTMFALPSHRASAARSRSENFTGSTSHTRTIC
jgi:hypothetical protein